MQRLCWRIARPILLVVIVGAIVLDIVLILTAGPVGGAAGFLLLILLWPVSFLFGKWQTNFMRSFILRSECPHCLGQVAHDEEQVWHCQSCGKRWTGRTLGLNATADPGAS